VHISTRGTNPNLIPLSAARCPKLSIAAWLAAAVAPALRCSSSWTWATINH